MGQGREVARAEAQKAESRGYCLEVGFLPPMGLEESRLPGFLVFRRFLAF